MVRTKTIFCQNLFLKRKIVPLVAKQPLNGGLTSCIKKELSGLKGYFWRQISEKSSSFMFCNVNSFFSSIEQINLMKTFLQTDELESLSFLYSTVKYMCELKLIILIK